MKAHINDAYINPTGAIGNGYYSGSSGQAGAINATGHGSNTDQSGQKDTTDHSIPINPIGATGHGSNTDQSGQKDTTGNNNSNYANGQISNEPTTSPTDAIGHGSTVHSVGQAEKNLTINPDATGHTTPKKEAIADLYMSDGDNYTIDDNAFSNAQMGTGDNSTAESVAGSSSGESGLSETNSNVNTGVFGGPARAAQPGYSLW